MCKDKKKEDRGEEEERIRDKQVEHTAIPSQHCWEGCNLTLRQVCNQSPGVRACVCVLAHMHTPWCVLVSELRAARHRRVRCGEGAHRPDDEQSEAKGRADPWAQPDFPV